MPNLRAVTLCEATLNRGRQLVKPHPQAWSVLAAHPLAQQLFEIDSRCFPLMPLLSDCEKLAALPSLHSISLAIALPEQPAALRVFAYSRSLTELQCNIKVPDDDSVHVDLLSSISQLPLQRLTLWNLALSSATMRRLLCGGELSRTLRYLMLREARLLKIEDVARDGDDGDVLAPQLRSVSLTHCGRVDHVMFPLLARCPSLQKLLVRCHCRPHVCADSLRNLLSSNPFLLVTVDMSHAQQNSSIEISWAVPSNSTAEKMARVRSEEVELRAVIEALKTMPRTLTILREK